MSDASSTEFSAPGPEPSLKLGPEPSPEPSPIPEERSAETPLAPGLYLVATPIGNLEDITLRALRILRSVDRIACEDTRQTQKLLNHFGIRKPTVSYHLHNEEGRAGELVAALKEGARLALVSDAGTPGIADPGAALVREAIAAGVVVYPLPGANAALGALVASGLSTENFTFHGFLPSKEGQRRSALEALRDNLRSTLRAGSPNQAPATQIFYESPHRILSALGDLVSVFGPGQPLVLARELTKLHEEFLRGSSQELLQALEQRPSIRGEFVLLLEIRPAEGGAASANAAPALSLAEEVAAAIRGGLSEKDALKRVARARGVGKSEAYREWQRQTR